MLRQGPDSNAALYAYQQAIVDRTAPHDCPTPTRKIYLRQCHYLNLRFDDGLEQHEIRPLAFCRKAAPQKKGEFLIFTSVDTCILAFFCKVKVTCLIHLKILQCVILNDVPALFFLKIVKFLLIIRRLGPG